MQLSPIKFFLLVILCSAFNKSQAQDSLFLKPLFKSGKYNTLAKPSGYSLFTAPLEDSIKIVPAQSRLPLNFYSTHLGTACKMELQLEKQTKLPIRIRLGSKEQVDYLEGKFNRYK